MPMLNIILFGPPGSGKGTQAEKLIAKYNLIHIATGDLLRNEIKNQTPLGLEAKKLIDEGLLVPDEVVIGMISSKVDESQGKKTKGLLFDGFPRTVPQAKALDKLLALRNIEITALLALEVSEEELTRRILNRGKTSGRSDDTDVSVIKQRIEEYQTKTAPIADYYAKQNKFVAVKGEGSIEEIFKFLCVEMDRNK